jgi:hypothetical protein
MMMAARIRLFGIWCIAVLCIVSARPAVAEKRVALVIGNSAYQNVTPLDNPRKDAGLMAEVLSGLGFSLIGGGAQFDLGKAAMDKTVQEFGRQVQGAEVALFYYAGHGVQVGGANYLVPVEANPTREADVDFQMMDANLVLRQMQGAGARLNVVILDACRNNPFGARGLRGADGGLAQMRAPDGTLISYATQPGNVAQDGRDGHSPYTKALAATLKRPGLDIFQTFNQVGLAVKRETGGSQQPWVSSSPIDGTFYFVPPALQPSQASSSTTDASASGAKPQPAQQSAAQSPAPAAATERLASHGSEAEPAAEPRKNDTRNSNFDGTWILNGVSTNCRGSGTIAVAISGSRVSGRGGGGSISPNGAYRGTTVGDDGVRLTASGILAGDHGRGTYVRTDGCVGRWTASRR